MKSVSLSIPKPCHEKWETFNPTKLGGFCTGCQKEVIDFTRWDEDEIKDYFLKSQNPECGRFNTAQLKTYSDKNKRTFRFSHWVSSSAITLILLLFTQRADAQMLKRRSVNEWVLPSQSQNKLNIISDSSVTIRGTVRSFEDSTVLAGVKVVMKGGLVFTETDSLGRFELTFSDSALIDTLEFSLFGFINERRTYRHEEMKVYLRSIMSGLSGTVGGVVAYRPWHPRTIWWKVRNIFSRNR